MWRFINDVIQICNDRYSHHLLQRKPLQDLRISDNLLGILGNFDLGDIGNHPVSISKERAQRPSLPVQAAWLEVV